MDRRELGNFFTSRGADRDCPACGYDGQWIRVEADRDILLVAQGSGGSEGIPVTAVLCRNCGFVRLHAIDVVLDKIVDPNESIPDN